MPDLTQYLWILWIALILVFVIIELLTLEFTFLMLAFGSIGGLGANILGLDWWLQIAIAAVLSAVLIFTIRPLLLNTLKRGADPARSNVDALHGLAGRVILTLGVDGGQVKLANGETWTARLDGTPHDTMLEPGSRVTVVAIEGSTAVVTPAELPAS